MNITTATGAYSGVIVSTLQKGNPLLKYLFNVPFKFEEIPSDYIVGEKTSILFLSLKFHALYPGYIHSKLREGSQSSSMIKYLLCYVDVDDPKSSILELTMATLVKDYTLILAWSYHECAKYIETFKKYEFKSADKIKEKVKTDKLSKGIQFLTQIRGINNTDAMNLVVQFGSIKNIAQATKEELLQLPGFGMKKINYLFDTLDFPFKNVATKPS